MRLRYGFRELKALPTARTNRRAFFLARCRERCAYVGVFRSGPDASAPSCCTNRVTLGSDRIVALPRPSLQNLGVPIEIRHVPRNHSLHVCEAQRSADGRHVRDAGAAKIQFRAKALFTLAAVAAQFGPLIADAQMLQHDRIGRNGASLLRPAPGRASGADRESAAPQHLVGDRVARPRRDLDIVGVIVCQHADAELPVEKLQHRRDAQRVGHRPLHGERLLPVGPHHIQAHAVGVQDRFDVSARDVEGLRVVERDIEALHEDGRLDIKLSPAQHRMLVRMQCERGIEPTRERHDGARPLRCARHHLHIRRDRNRLKQVGPPAAPRRHVLLHGRQEIGVHLAANVQWTAE